MLKYMIGAVLALGLTFAEARAAPEQQRSAGSRFAEA